MVRIVKGLRRRGVVLAAFGLLLAGCGSAPQRPESGATAASGAVVVPGGSLPEAARPAAESAVQPLPAVAAVAVAQLGVPYRLGGADPAGFDCSGLVQWAFAAAGVAVPRTTEEQFTWFRPLPREDLQPGDLVFFRLPQAHVGIYLGAGEFVHAPTSGRAVERARLDSPWFILGFAGGGRAPLAPSK